MPKNIDVRKHEQWRARLERFEAARGTVAQFCREEGVTPHRFYYWAKQLRRVGNNGIPYPNRRPAGDGTKVTSPAGQRTAGTSPDDHCGVEPTGTLQPVVRFTWESGLRVSVPADCLPAIRCVLDFLRREGSGDCGDESTAPAFRQVIVTERE